MTTTMHSNINFNQLALDIKQWGMDLGFQQVGITDTDLSDAEPQFLEWLKKGFHGDMAWMEKYGSKRARPEELVPGTLRIISVRMDYLPPDPKFAKILAQPNKAFISRYAVGGDYHKLIRKRLEKLAQKIQQQVGNVGYRAFTDSAPILEKPIAAKAGLGWQGKHTCLINQKAGSYFFLGELFTDLPLPIDAPVKDHCGSCNACINVCPTNAIVAPYQLDARRCIAYLTIELRTSIPVEFRAMIGNRVYGCDDCQMICPWNRFAKSTQEDAFKPRNNVDDIELLTLFAWSEQQFLKNTEGSAIRRIGYDCWLRNIAVALGNAPYNEKIIEALNEKLSHPSEMVREHVIWALERQKKSYQ